MKKFVSIILVAILSFSYIVFCTGAVWVPPIENMTGDEDGPGVLYGSSTDAVQVNWEQLNALLVTVNIAMGKGHYRAVTAEWPGCVCKLWQNTSNSRWYIRLYSSTGTATSLYLCDVGGRDVTDSGVIREPVVGRFYAYAPTDDSTGLKPILDKCKDIYNYYTQTLTTKLNSIISYIDGMEGFVDGVEGKLDTIITNTSSTASKLDRLVVSTDGVTQTAAELLRYIFDRMDRLIVTRNNTTYTVAELEYNIYSTLQSVSGYVDGIESTLLTISSRINTTNTRLNTVNSNLTSISDKLDNIDTSDPVDYSSVLSQIAGNTGDDIYVTLYTTDSNGNAYSTISYRPEIIDGIISYLTTNMQNKPLKVLYRDGNIGEVSQEVRFFMLANFNNGYIRLRVMLEDGTFGFAYLSTPNRVLIKYDNTYVDDSTFYQKISDIESALYGTVQTRSNELVPIGESMLDVVSNGTTIISNVVALSSPIGLIKTGVDTIVDLIEAFEQDPDYSTVLNNINNALRVTVDGDTYTIAQLESISAQHLNNIEEWLTAADLLDNQTITAIVNSYGSDIVDGVTKSSKFIQLYQKAFGSLRSYGVDDDYIWNEIFDYFDTFYGGGTQ